MTTYSTDEQEVPAYERVDWRKLPGTRSTALYVSKEGDRFRLFMDHKGEVTSQWMPMVDS